jgi:hypothetical protein
MRAPYSFLSQTRCAAAGLGVAMLMGLGLFAPPAQAAYTVTLTQVGSNVVASGSGTINLTGLDLEASGVTVPVTISPEAGQIITGLTPTGSVDEYTNFSGPDSFGSGGGTSANGGTGNLVGIDGEDETLYVPAGYTTDSTTISLSDTATYDDTTLAMLGVTPGTYVWTWGAVSDDDTFTLTTAVAAVPEPSSVLLLAPLLGFVIVLAARRLPWFSAGPSI